ncbi:DUF1796 family putative cysteine peptidase [Paenibacillus sp. TH7-28]
MKLADLKGSYDAIFSLGDLCLSALQLEKNNLRPYAGVFDWVASPNLDDVCRLIATRFKGFMELENLRVGGVTDTGMIWVTDDANSIISSHDFEASKNTVADLADYPEVRAKYDRRIERFLNKLAMSRRILFVRTEGTLEEAKLLEQTLNRTVKHDFRVLLVNHTQVRGTVELNWPLEKVCAIELSDLDKWNGNDLQWKQIFQGIRYVPNLNEGGEK